MKHLPVCLWKQIQSWWQASWVKCSGKNFCQFISETRTRRMRKKPIKNTSNCKAFCVTRKRNKKSNCKAFGVTQKCKKQQEGQLQISLRYMQT